MTITFDESFDQIVDGSPSVRLRKEETTRGAKRRGTETRGRRMSAATKNVEHRAPVRYETRIKARGN